MTRRAFRSSFAAMSLGAAVLVFGCPADAEARPGGGTRSMALGAQSRDAARAVTNKQTTVKRRSVRGKAEPAKN